MCKDMATQRQHRKVYSPSSGRGYDRKACTNARYLVSQARPSHARVKVWPARLGEEAVLEHR